MLREFPMNTDPSVGWAQESLFALFGLNDPSLTMFVHVQVPWSEGSSLMT